MAVPIRRINKGKGIRTLKLKFGDDVLNIKYDRSKYTPAVERELNDQLEQKNLVGGLFAGFLGNLILEWDAMDVDPEDREKALELESDPDNLPGMKEYEAAGIRMVPVPLTPETFDTLLSIETQGDLMTELGKDQRPNPTSSDFTSNS